MNKQTPKAVPQPAATLPIRPKCGGAFIVDDDLIDLLTPPRGDLSAMPVVSMWRSSRTRARRRRPS